MLNLTNLTKIFSKIMLAHDADHYKRVNTVAQIGFLSDLGLLNLNRTYADVEAGTYCRRKELTRDDLKREYGLLTVMRKKVPIPDLAYNEKQLLVDIMIGFPINCKNCPEYYRTSMTVIDELNENIMLSFKDKLFEFHEYKIDNEGTDEVVFEHPDNVGGLTVLEDRSNILDLGYFERSGTTYIEHFTMGADLVRWAKMPLMISNCEIGDQSLGS